MGSLRPRAGAGRIDVRAVSAIAGVLGPQLPMLAGHALDRLVGTGAPLCLTVASFDPELLRLAVASCPFMHGGMLLGLLLAARTDGWRGFPVRVVAHAAAMLLAMGLAAHLWPGSASASLVAMMAAMGGMTFLKGHRPAMASFAR